MKLTTDRDTKEFTLKGDLTELTSLALTARHITKMFSEEEAETVVRKLMSKEEFEHVRKTFDSIDRFAFYMAISMLEFLEAVEKMEKNLKEDNFKYAKKNA